MGFKTSKWQNMLLKSTMQLGLRWVLPGFLGGCTKKPNGFFEYVPGYPNPDYMITMHACSRQTDRQTNIMTDALLLELSSD